MIMMALDLSHDMSSSGDADDDSPVLLLTRLGERAFAATRLAVTSAPPTRRDCSGQCVVSPAGSVPPE